MAIVVEVNGIEVNTQQLAIDNVINSQPDTAIFWMPEPDNIPIPGHSISIFRSETPATILFGGLVVSTRQVRLAVSADSSLRTFNFFVRCQDFQRLLDRLLVVRTYEFKTCREIIANIVISFTDPALGFTIDNVQDGPVVESINFSYVRVSEAIRQLANLANYNWYVDHNKDIHFFQLESELAPFNIDETAVTSLVDNFQITPNYDQIANSVFVRGGFFFNDIQITQNIAADGLKRIYTVNITPDSTNFTLTVGGIGRVLGIKNIDPDDGSKDWFVDTSEKNIEAAAAETTPTDGTVLSFSYNPAIPIIVKHKDEAKATLLGGLEGGSGEYQTIVYDFTITSQEEARERAKTESLQRSDPDISGSFTTVEHGWKAGDFFIINVDGYENYDGLYQVQSVTITMDGSEIDYTVEFGNIRITNQGSFAI